MIQSVLEKKTLGKKIGGSAQNRLENLRKMLKEEAKKKAEENDSTRSRKVKFKEKDKKAKNVQQNIKIMQTLELLEKSQEGSPKKKVSNENKVDTETPKPAKKKRIEKDDFKCVSGSQNSSAALSRKRKAKIHLSKQSLNTKSDACNFKISRTPSPCKKRLVPRFQEEASVRIKEKYDMKKCPTSSQKMATNEKSNVRLNINQQPEATFEKSKNYSTEQFKKTTPVESCSNLNICKKPKSPTKALRETAIPDNMPKQEKGKIVTTTGKSNLYKRKHTYDTSGDASQEKKMNTFTKYYSNLQEKITSSFKTLVNWANPKENIACSTSSNIDKNYNQMIDLEKPLILHLQNVRNLVNSNDSEEMDWEISFASDSTVNFETLKTNVYVVVDTNVFLSAIGLIQKIGNVKIQGKNIVIFVPWQVLKELDYLKKDKSIVSYNARTAITYLFNAFSASDPGILGQTLQSANSTFPGFEVEVADDHLIKCCLQLKCENQNVMLLTNDKNLAVKSLVHGVCVMNAKQLTEVIKIHSSSAPEEILDQTHPIEKQPEIGCVQRPFILKMFVLANIFKEFLSMVIEKYLKDKYGDIWTWYLPQKLPLGIIQLLKKVRDMSNFFPQDISRQISLNSTSIENILHKHDNDLWFSVYESEQFGKFCYKLITSFSFGFKDEVNEYDRRTAFYKCKNPAGPEPDSTYRLECCKTAMRHFDLFHDKLTLYCCWLSNVIRVPFIPTNQPSSLQCVENFTIEERSVHKNYVSQLIHSLKSISEVPIQNVTEETKGVREVYAILAKYGGANCEEDFSFEDVLEFAKDESVRVKFPMALDLLSKLLILL
ncbi:transcriptional protein SWT1 isoform X4 [Cimex lectularius]|uniref:PIN domain-containing protein n=1 Tax=Cimex lectularius TaxID=79782 RepID=A0A8I6SLU0_CIMLE|nr:transcriptional protein SWT1 isoform X4 [Cimex lectularius]